MKNKKGEIATLLTLGLVLVGTLITLGTSFFVNKTKIASNPKAQCAGPIPSPSKACCFCKKGKVTVYASSTARVNNCMDTPCTTDAYGTAYGATNWGYCDNGGSVGSYEGGACTGGGGGITPNPEEGTPVPFCKTPETTCTLLGYGTSTDSMSIDKDKNYYFGKNCGETNKIGDLSAFITKCTGLVSGDCTPVGCDLLLGNANPDVDFGGKQVSTKTDSSGVYYKYQLDNNQPKCLQTVDLSIECFPKGPTNTPTPTLAPVTPTKLPPFIGVPRTVNGVTYLNCASFEIIKSQLKQSDPAAYCTSIIGTILFQPEPTSCCI